MLAIVNHAVDAAPVRPGSQFTLALALAADALLDAEAISEIEPRWDAIESEAAVAIEFRQILGRRKRWALEFDRLFAVFRNRLVRGFGALIEALPDGCFEHAGDDETSLTVPLSSMLYEPAAAIERLMLSAYDDDVFRLDLFHTLRQRLATNLTIASGFPPETEPNVVSTKLVMPTLSKKTSATELVDLYLAGTPFEDVLDQPIAFQVPTDLRFEHTHVIGGTGHGKTQLLQRMIYADLVSAQRDGRSVVVIDSQGDLIQKLIRLELFDPAEGGGLADRLVIIDPADVEYPPSLNLFDIRAARLANYSPANRERALNGIIELYETFFGALLGAELTQKQGVIFRFIARLMLAIPGATIHTLMSLMDNGHPYRPYMQQLDGSARHFFETEFFQPSFSATKKQILKRLWGVLSTPAFERMFAQKTRKLDLFEAMNSGKIVFINTAKDLLKTEGSSLFGRFFISLIAQAALERSVIPERERTPTFVYVDEAQEYFDDSIETILSQARKYRVGMTMAHQTLDQLSPRLRAAFLANSSLKCAGGVSARDARALASEMHTTPEFMEGMRKRAQKTEFAVWLKGRTPTALRLDVPIGFVERKPTLSEAAFDAVIERNRQLYCGTLDTVLTFEPPPPARAQQTARNENDQSTSSETRASAEQHTQPSAPVAPPSPVVRTTAAPAPARPESRDLGKGGPKHRYLQSLVKELGEQQGFRATIEAPLPNGRGQIDVLLERDGLRLTFEVSVSTSVEHERQNLRKCLQCDFDHVVFVLAKSRSTQGQYRTALIEGLSDSERRRLTFLAPEEVPDFLASFAPAPAPSETVVKGYRVRVSHTPTSPEDGRERRDRLAKLIARSLRNTQE